MVDFAAAAGLIGAMTRRSLALAVWFCCAIPAAAMVGGAPPAPELAKSLALLVGSRGSSCTAVALARDLLLTAGHCVMPGADYKLVEFDAARTPALHDLGAIHRHPQFDADAAARHRVTADVALVKLPAPRDLTPLPLASGGKRVSVGDRVVIAGYGLTIPGDGRSGGTARSATLAVTGQPGTLQFRLFDPVAKGERAGLGACTGDSGGPALVEEDGRMAIAGVVSWTTGPKLSEGCGGITGVTPLVRYRDWIVSTAAKLGSPILR